MFHRVSRTWSMRALVLVVLAACAVEAPTSTHSDTVLPPATCSNGALDHGETDVDCGGACGICAVGDKCLTQLDCFDGSTSYIATCWMEEGGDAPRCAEGVAAGFPVSFGSPSQYSYVSGSTTWYRDYYTGQWCNGSQIKTGSHGWDYTTCDWEGWRTVDGNRFYCSAGWFWQEAFTHTHCP
jgi:hypothetical protein